MAQATIIQPYETVRCVRIESRETFSEDLGSFGLTVPPRVGEVARKSRHKEDFCLRRLLIAWKEAGMLSFPLSVERRKNPSGRENWPDFAVRQGQTGATIGIEVVEATDREYQAKLTAQAEEARDAIASVQVDARLPVIPVRALRNKNRKALDGNYSGVPDLELLIYENIEAPLVDMNKVIQSLRKGKYKPAHLGFARVNIISGETVWLDVFGAVPRPISLAANYDVDFVSWAREQARLARTAGGQRRSRARS